MTRLLVMLGLSSLALPALAQDDGLDWDDVDPRNLDMPDVDMPDVDLSEPNAMAPACPVFLRNASLDVEQTDAGFVMDLTTRDPGDVFALQQAVFQASVTGFRDSAVPLDLAERDDVELGPDLLQNSYTTVFERPDGARVVVSPYMPRQVDDAHGFAADLRDDLREHCGVV